MKWLRRKQIQEVAPFKIAKLNVRKGDILVLMTDYILTPTQVTDLRSRLNAELPAGVKTVICTHGIKLGVLRMEVDDKQPVTEST